MKKLINLIVIMAAFILAAVCAPAVIFAEGEDYNAYIELVEYNKDDDGGIIVLNVCIEGENEAPAAAEVDLSFKGVTCTVGETELVNGMVSYDADSAIITFMANEDRFGKDGSIVMGTLYFEIDDESSAGLWITDSVAVLHSQEAPVSFSSDEALAPFLKQAAPAGKNEAQHQTRAEETPDKEIGEEETADNKDDAPEEAPETTRETTSEKASETTRKTAPETTPETTREATEKVASEMTVETTVSASVSETLKSGQTITDNNEPVTQSSDKNEENSSSVWVIVLLSIAAACVIAALIIVIVRKRKKK